MRSGMGPVVCASIELDLSVLRVGQRSARWDHSQPLTPLRARPGSLPSHPGPHGTESPRPFLATVHFQTAARGSSLQVLGAVACCACRIAGIS